MPPLSQADEDKARSLGSKILSVREKLGHVRDTSGATPQLKAQLDSELKALSEEMAEFLNDLEARTRINTLRFRGHIFTVSGRALSVITESRIGDMN